MDIMDFWPSIPVHWALSIRPAFTVFADHTSLESHHGCCPLSLTGPLGKTQFAPPRVIQTGNGVHFTRNMFKELTKLLHATNYYTIRYHPQVNGLIEHTNRVVKSALTSLVSDRPCT